tara:strand:+ start:10240 stop:12465 length:2226 start_codon:yes stop_codon:yes gene_type:complete
MIESVTIGDIATYPKAPQTLDDLKVINYVFGSNGVGKSTLGRVLKDPAIGSACSVRWRGGTTLDVLALNRDFIDDNFGQLRGVFTLGEQQTGIEEQIEKKREEQRAEAEKRRKLRATLQGQDGASGKLQEVSTLEDHFKELCWRVFEKHDPSFEKAFQGHRNNKQSFKTRVLKEHAENTASSKPLEDLSDRALTVFGNTPEAKPLLPVPSSESILAHELNEVLQKKVIGKDDVDIAAMIERLGNSDWVQQGLPYFKENDGACPFCQQDTAPSFTSDLEDYFDETFTKDKNSIVQLSEQYTRDADNLISVLNGIIEKPGEYLDTKVFTSQVEVIKSTLDTNSLQITAKTNEPSRPITLKSVKEPLEAVYRAIDEANTRTTTHNTRVANLSSEKTTLTAEVWRLVLDELAIDLADYSEKKRGLESAIASLNTQITACDSKYEELEREIVSLEQQTTSIQPTINAINSTLSKFGFTSFSLAASEDGKHYRLVRQSGEDASRTLSEGEKTFVVFLYFYHLLNGSLDASGTTSDRVVVFDDPVSSLDSDVLFIVSTLIREVFQRARDSSSGIRQVFLLTHNVYFHKEVTFSGNPSGGVLRDETFWVLSRSQSQSRVKLCDDNPVKTSYELLWDEVRDAVRAIESGEAIGIRVENSMRRILEHYFKILGSVNLDELYKQFEGDEKILCQSLLSWVHAGSHAAMDDAHFTASEQTVSRNLSVFERIFTESGHPAHYEMMMGPLTAPSE